MLPDTMKPDAILAHYDEIALKKGNRPYFVRRLVENIRQAIRPLGLQDVLVLPGRILIPLATSTPQDEALSRIARVFGIANFFPVWRCPANIAEGQTLALQLIEGRQFDSFRIAARREEKRHAFTSMDINTALGRAVQEKSGARVDLSNPGLTIAIEVLAKEMFIGLEKRRGPGGLPVGVEGRVACLMSGGIDSPVAAYLMMKRGCRVTFIHFHSYPFVSRASWEKAEELAAHLTKYQFRSRLFLVGFGDVQRAIVLGASAPLRVILYRRMMLRIASDIARRERALALVTGESMGQVASQTLRNLTTIESASDLPIFRPLIGFDKVEIIDRARALGTYPISIEPDEDCCSLFVPKHPEVAAHPEIVREAEEKLDIPALLKTALNAVTIREFRAD